MRKRFRPVVSIALLSFVMGIALFSIFYHPLAWKNSKNPMTFTFSAGLCHCSIKYSRLYGSLMEDTLYCNCSKSIDLSPECPPSQMTSVEKEPIKVFDDRLVKEPCPEKEKQRPLIPSVVKHHAWWAQGRVWHYPVRFPRCSMDVCFNYSRCDNMEDLLIYSYHVPASPVRYFSRINHTEWHTDDPSRACLFFVFLDDQGPWHPHPRGLPYWNGGLNHVLITFADKWSLRGPAEESIDAASIMASDMHETIYRPGFDISIPLEGRVHLPELQGVKPLERKYLLTFRGKRYLGNNQELGVLRSYNSFRQMHNGDDVIIATSCRHRTNDMKRKENPSLGVHCDEDELIYNSYSYKDLMNSTFGLVPAGVQPNSYRFIEVLSAGAIPVLIADNYVKPFEQLIHWHVCILQFPSSEMDRIVPTVRALRTKEIEERQKSCLEIYQLVKNDDASLNTVIRALKARFMGVFSNFTVL